VRPDSAALPSQKKSATESGVRWVHGGATRARGRAPPAERAGVVDTLEGARAGIVRDEPPPRNDTFVLEPVPRTAEHGERRGFENQTPPPRLAARVEKVLEGRLHAAQPSPQPPAVSTAWRLCAERGGVRPPEGRRGTHRPPERVLPANPGGQYVLLHRLPGPDAAVLGYLAPCMRIQKRHREQMYYENR
jgi:hypothetical protein